MGVLLFYDCGQDAGAGAVVEGGCVGSGEGEEGRDAVEEGAGGRGGEAFDCFGVGWGSSGPIFVGFVVVVGGG